MNLWLIEDHRALRESLVLALQQARPGWSVQAYARSGDALSAAAGGAAADVLLLDLGLPGLGGLEALPLLKSALPVAEVVVFTVFDDADKIYAAICAGASGYLLKSEPVETLVRAVEEVREGGSPMHPQVARKVLDRFSGRRPAPESILSERERGVLQAMADGLTKKEIAARLDLSVHTVDNYLRRIYRKLHVNTLQGAVAKAFKDGLL
jgi:DNA-binding NarL/FixJ family response regulator